LDLGRTHAFYDLASLTKVMFTVSVLMRLYDRGDFRPGWGVRDLLPWWRHQTVFRELLTHTGGLEWWWPAYKHIRRGPRRRRREQLKSCLRKIKVRRTGRAVYSDPDFWLLGFAVEEICQSTLEDVFAEYRSDAQLGKLHFCADNKPLYRRSLYAPTEKCPWRRKTLRGEVHDDNAWSLGGVAAHAGLFGGVDDVAAWGLALRRSVLGVDERFCKSATARLFVRRQLPRRAGDFGLGFSKPSKEGSSSGRYFSPDSYGHLGFTGTSYWYDPRLDLQVVLLSNRVHPTRENIRFRPLRGVIHNIVVEALELT
jgi:CubicO group peptidase (beta-lactamase class C family)